MGYYGNPVMGILMMVFGLLSWLVFCGGVAVAGFIGNKKKGNPGFLFMGISGIALFLWELPVSILTSSFMMSRVYGTVGGNLYMIINRMSTIVMVVIGAFFLVGLFIAAIKDNRASG